MLKQLRIKFVAVTMSLITLLLCVIMLVLFCFTAAALDTDVSEKMQTVTERLSHRGLPPDRPLFDDSLHYFILTKNYRGDLFALGTENFDFLDDATIRDIYGKAASDSKLTGNLNEYALKYRHISGFSGAIMFADISKEQTALKTLAKGCIRVSLLALVLFGLLTVKLAYWIVKPVEAAWEQQRQFVSDASHELKTPLTVIMTNAEMLSAPEYSPAEKNGFADNILNMTKRMRLLVEGMLDLARVDNGVVKSAMESVNYSQLNLQSVLLFEPLFYESGRLLITDIIPDIHVTGSPSHLTQVTDILLDNAIKYSTPNTDTLLSLHIHGRYAVVCVDSMGAPLSAEEREHIFRRFYTVDKSRTGDSCGLGLSIAKGIVEEHGGKIWAESDGGHNRFFVKLPL